MADGNRAGRSSFGRAARDPAPAPPPQAGTDINRVNVMRRTLSALLRNFVTFLALTAAAAVPERILYHLLMFADPVQIIPLLEVVSLFSRVALLAAVTRGAFDAFDGNPVNFARCMGAGAIFYPPALAVGTVFVLAFAVPAGLVYLLIVHRLMALDWLEAALLVMVPGFLVSTFCAVVLPVRMREGLGIRACFARSAALIADRLPTMLALAAGYLFWLCIIAYYMMPGWGIPHKEPLAIIGFIGGNWLMPLLATTIGGVGMAALYWELCLAETGSVPDEPDDSETIPASASI